MNSRQGKLNKEFQKLCGDFIERESNRTSLITVTRCEISPDFKNLKIMVSVLPVEQEEVVIHFLNRKKRELREVLKKKINTRIIPFVEFYIDMGEKNRQEIDRLLKEV